MFDSVLIQGNTPPETVTFNDFTVCDKVKRANLKTKETKLSTPNFPKNEHFLPPDTHASFFAKKLTVLLTIL